MYLIISLYEPTEEQRFSFMCERFNGSEGHILMSQWSSQMLKIMLSLLRYAQHKYTYEHMFVILILS